MKTFLYLVCLSLPLFAAVGLVIFMAGGKGKPKPTQDELVEREKVHLEGVSQSKPRETNGNVESIQ
ncbi:hypothetical protein HZ996_00745 [Cryomorphaceae bacterium]|nr:hypothetical protein HZ996_00745 [Cryomorphaceae bacterium]